MANKKQNVAVAVILLAVIAAIVYAVNKASKTPQQVYNNSNTNSTATDGTTIQGMDAPDGFDPTAGLGYLG